MCWCRWSRFPELQIDVPRTLTRLSSSALCLAPIGEDSLSVLVQFLLRLRLVVLTLTLLTEALLTVAAVSLRMRRFRMRKPMVENSNLWLLVGSLCLDSIRFPEEKKYITAIIKHGKFSPKNTPPFPKSQSCPPGGVAKFLGRSWFKLRAESLSLKIQLRHTIENQRGKPAESYECSPLWQYYYYCFSSFACMFMLTSNTRIELQ